MNESGSQIQRALQGALFFRDRGYNPLPARSDRKSPMLASFTEFWSQPVPQEVYADWAAENVQVMCGARWKLCVVDCDGDQAHNVFRAMKRHHDPDQVGPYATWTARTGGGGWHFWFTLPDHVKTCESRRVWGLWDTWGGSTHQGDWAHHREIRLLGDGALVVAPPSLHVETRVPYAWITGRGPDELPEPGPVPAWVLDLPVASPCRGAPSAPPGPLPAPPPESPLRPAGGLYERDEVLHAIKDKIALARRWGLRIASPRPNAKGWVACHAIGREDKSPSASISESSGVYCDLAQGVRLSLFDLAAALGAYPDWQAAKNALGDEFVGRPRTRERERGRVRV
jgi:hypothetical protein